MDILLILLLLGILLIVAWALFGKGDGAEETKEETAPDRMFRRRASDHEIEEKYPEPGERRRRRSSDGREEGETAEPVEPDDVFKLPYAADEIITDTSQFRIYKRTLINSEIYAKKGDFETAISLYEGVNSRINDTNTNRKIEANIDYIRNYKAFREQAKREEESRARQFKQKQANEIRLSVDGPLQIPDRIQIGLTVPPQPAVQPPIDTESIIEEITKKIIDSKLVDTRRDTEIRKYLDEIDELKGGIKDLISEIRDREAAPEKPVSGEEAGRRNRELESKVEELSRLKDEMARLDDKLRVLERQRESVPQIPVSEEKPAIIQARYESPVPVTLDPRPIIEILERIPRQVRPEPPAPKEPEPAVEVKADIPLPAVEPEPVSGEPEAAGAAASAVEAERVIETAPESPTPVENVEEAEPTPAPAVEMKKEHEDIRRDIASKHDELESDEEWELISQYGKEKELDALTDEDIFSKILRDDHKGKIQDSIEILGDRKRQEGPASEVNDAEYSRKNREDEEFYEKFLRHERRVRKELPILKVSYDFSRLPDEFSLSRDKNILEYSFYKYKPLLEKANGFIKTRRVRDALNYYKMVMNQNIPPEFKSMIRRNINDLTEYLEKYLSSD